MNFLSRFESIDRDNDGVITESDLEYYSRKHLAGSHFTQTWLLLFDLDHDEVISYHDIEDLIAKYGPKSDFVNELNEMTDSDYFDSESDTDSSEEDKPEPPPFRKPVEEEDSLPPKVQILGSDLSTKTQSEYKVLCATRSYILRSKPLKYCYGIGLLGFSYESIILEDSAENGETGTPSDSDDESSYASLERQRNADKASALNRFTCAFKSYANKAIDCCSKMTTDVRRQFYRRSSSKTMEDLKANCKIHRELKLCEVQGERLVKHLERHYGGNWKFVLNPNPGVTIQHHSDGLIFFKFRDDYFHHAILIWRALEVKERFFQKFWRMITQMCDSNNSS
ncbi:hypothetical protein Ciccas_005163 [Cichlidogyrus casuarinus]|uniref:EF-hand domain-containing protein n=1 Tax=Cichlidogyrus casuarinus TaxID=1844966 RepID=A0ABD2Q9H2_9PLAT